MIAGIKIQLASGAVLVNEQGVNWYHAALRAIAKHDWTWLKGEGAEIGADLPSGQSSSALDSLNGTFYGGASATATGTTSWTIQFTHFYVY